MTKKKDPLTPTARSRHDKEGRPAIKCNRIDKTAKSINIYLRPNEALQLAQGLIQKARMLIEEGLAEDRALQLWNIKGETLSIGIEMSRGKRRKKPRLD